MDDSKDIRRRLSTQAQIERLWAELADDPERQALDCAALCVTQAPQLAAWLKAKILDGIPDRELALITRPPVTDGRILAYSQLCALSGPTAAPPANKPSAASPVIRRVGQGNPHLSSFQAKYRAIFGVIPETLPDVSDAIRVEPELGRAAIALKLAGLFRLYVVAREMTRRGDGSGRANKQTLREELRGYGVLYTREHFSRLLRAGESLFWNRSRKDLYLYKPARVAAAMAARDPAVFASNKPGVRDMYISPRGSHEAWEASLYAGWLAYRNNPTIARETLAQLFGRSADTLRQWEAQHLTGQVTVRRNYTQCPHPNVEDARYFNYIPAHSQAYRGTVRFQGQWRVVTRLYWQTCNSYQVKGMRQHPRRGQAGKVRKAINDVLNQPANARRGGSLRFKRYFETPEGLKRQVDKHGGVYYLWCGENSKGHGIFELNGTGFRQTQVNEFQSTLSHSEEEL